MADCNLPKKERQFAFFKLSQSPKNGNKKDFHQLFHGTPFAIVFLRTDFAIKKQEPKIL
jgi:hypothetical protein